MKKKIYMDDMFNIIVWFFPLKCKVLSSNLIFLILRNSWIIYQNPWYYYLFSGNHIGLFSLNSYPEAHVQLSTDHLFLECHRISNPSQFTHLNHQSSFPSYLYILLHLPIWSWDSYSSHFCCHSSGF